MNTIMYKKTYDNVYQNFSTTASFEGFAGSTADPSTLAELMLYNSYPFDSEELIDQAIKGHDLDFTLEKLMKKYNPALKKLAEL